MFDCTLTQFETISINVCLCVYIDDQSWPTASWFTSCNTIYHWRLRCKFHPHIQTYQCANARTHVRARHTRDPKRCFRIHMYIGKHLCLCDRARARTRTRLHARICHFHHTLCSLVHIHIVWTVRFRKGKCFIKLKWVGNFNNVCSQNGKQKLLVEPFKEIYGPFGSTVSAQKKSANICGRQKLDPKCTLVQRNSRRFSPLNSGFDFFYSHICWVCLRISGTLWSNRARENPNTDIYKFYANINLIISPFESFHFVLLSFDLQPPIFRSYIFNFWLLIEVLLFNFHF